MKKKPEFYNISRTKFLIFYILSGGFFDLYWQYRNWKYLKQTTQQYKKIWPFWRAVFSIIWFGILYRKVDNDISEEKLAAHALLYALSFGTAFLDNPYWLLGYISIIPLLSLRSKIEKRNQSKHPHTKNENHRFPWTIVNTLWSIFLLPVFFLMLTAILTAFYITPSTATVTGSTLHSYQYNYLYENNLIEKEEVVKYFYSRGFFSIEADGSIITDKGITSYETNPHTDVLEIHKATYDEIEMINITQETFISDVIVEVFLYNNDSFLLYLSDEEDTYDQAIELLLEHTEHWNGQSLDEAHRYTPSHAWAIVA